MRVEVLLEAHQKYLKEKYEHLYDVKFPWAVNELRDALVRDHIRRVCMEIDEEKYLREVRDMETVTAPIDIPQK
jgi:hypothetical protein